MQRQNTHKTTDGEFYQKQSSEDLADTLKDATEKWTASALFPRPSFVLALSPFFFLSLALLFFCFFRSLNSCFLTEIEHKVHLVERFFEASVFESDRSRSRKRKAKRRRPLRSVHSNAFDDLLLRRVLRHLDQSLADPPMPRLRQIEVVLSCEKRKEERK